MGIFSTDIAYKFSCKLWLAAQAIARLVLISSPHNWNIGNFPDNSALLKSNTKDVKIAVSSNYLSNFWRTIQLPLITC